MISGAILTPR